MRPRPSSGLYVLQEGGRGGQASRFKVDDSQLSRRPCSRRWAGRCPSVHGSQALQPGRRRSRPSEPLRRIALRVTQRRPKQKAEGPHERRGHGLALTTVARSARGRWPPRRWRCSWVRAGTAPAPSGCLHSPAGAQGGTRHKGISDRRHELIGCGTRGVPPPCTVERAAPTCTPMLEGRGAAPHVNTAPSTAAFTLCSMNSLRRREGGAIAGSQRTAEAAGGRRGPAGGGGSASGKQSR